MISPAKGKVQGLERGAIRKASGRFGALNGEICRDGPIVQCYNGPSRKDLASTLPSRPCNPALLQLRGRVEIITGPMFAGKSTALLARVREENQAGRKVAVVKPSMDTRYQCEHVTTHAGDRLPCMTSDRLLPLLCMTEIMDAEVIAVDEAQFFPDLVDFVTSAAEEHSRTVVVAGLDGDYQRQRFGQILDLVPLADCITKLSGKCHFCEAKSLFSLRVVADDRQELIGGVDKYVPTCRHHYVQLASTRLTHD